MFASSSPEPDEHDWGSAQRLVVQRRSRRRVGRPMLHQMSLRRLRQSVNGMFGSLGATDAASFPCPFLAAVPDADGHEISCASRDGGAVAGLQAAGTRPPDQFLIRHR
jgi:hypothetical protein